MIRATNSVHEDDHDEREYRLSESDRKALEVGIAAHVAKSLGANAFVPERLAYNIRETAFLLGGISTKSVRRLIERGLLRQSVGLRHKLIPRSEIERYLTETSPAI